MSHYRLVNRVGAGGMGVVYRARDERLGRDVALKLLPPALHADADARHRLTQEARAAAALDHPNVASVYDVGEAEGGRMFLVMGFYDGETLAEEIARGPLDAERARELGRQLADGLAAIHRAEIVHRDIKPANVIVLPDAAPGGGVCAKILDFGIAKTDGVQITQEGQSVGTELYMSPEQILGDPVDARTDVWGLGAVVYEMLTARSPFGGLYAAAVSFNVLHRDPRPIERDDVSDALKAVVMRCLEKAPEDRYASMDELAAALDAPNTEEPPVASPTAFAEDAPAATAPESPQTASPAASSQDGGLPASWRRWAAAALALVALGLVAALRTGGGADEAETARLAVLPFRAVGAETEQLSVGLVETLTSKLSQLESLRGRVRIVPASEVTGEMTSSDARSRLRATHVVEGVVQIEDGRVRVSLNLIDVQAEQADQVGARQLDDASGSGFAIQDAAVVQVADLLRTIGLLRVEVSIDELAAGGTDDPEANALYLRARGVLRNHQSAEDLDRTRALFEEAIARDPDFALAHAGLAEAQWQTYQFTREVAWTDRALASSQRALDLNDALPEVYIARATVYQGSGDLSEALAALDRALELDPNSMEAYRRQAKVFAELGRPRKAESAFLRAVELEPDVWRPYNSLGVFYLTEGREDEAAEQFQRALQLDPVNLSLFFNLGVASWLGGDIAEAAKAFEEVQRLDPSDADAVRGLSVARLYLGDATGAAEAARRAVALRPEDYASHEALADASWWTRGQRDVAREQYRTTLDVAREHLTVGRDPDVLLAMAKAFAVAGQADSARTYLREIGQRVSRDSWDVQSAFSLAIALDLTGQRAQALEWLQSATERGYGATQLRRSPWLRDLRSDPRAAPLLSP